MVDEIVAEAASTAEEVMAEVESMAEDAGTAHGARCRAMTA